MARWLVFRDTMDAGYMRLYRVTAWLSQAIDAYVYNSFIEAHGWVEKKGATLEATLLTPNFKTPEYYLPTNDAYIGLAVRLVPPRG